MLFTTLVPVYKTQFLEDTVQCLNAQSRKTFQVIFSDDSPTQDLAEVLADIHLTCPISFPYRITQGKRIGPASNCHDLFATWLREPNTPYIHFFLDDDLIFPDFYLWHERALQQTQAKLCISARIVVDEQKTPFVHATQPDFITQQNANIIRLPFADCISSTLPSLDNWMGELSCATFDGHALAATLKGQILNLPYYGINDLGLFLEMAAAHPIYYLNQALGAFRINRWQTSRDQQSAIFQATNLAWAALIFDAHQMGALPTLEATEGLLKLKKSLAFMRQQAPCLQGALGALALLPEISSCREAFRNYWLHFLASQADYVQAKLPPAP
jgi:hypothetical protein